MNIAIILASGSGSRIKSSNLPKQFVVVNDKPILFYSVLTFEKCSYIDQIIIVSNEDYFDFINKWINLLNISKVSNLVKGGNSRQESSYLGVTSVNACEDDIILIHDAARPLISEEIIINNIKAAKEHKSVITAIKSTDSIVSIQDGYLNREHIYSVQTPQTFKFKDIKSAHESAVKNGILNASDDASLFDEKPCIVEGSKINFKITNDEDLSYFICVVK